MFASIMMWMLVLVLSVLSVVARLVTSVLLKVPRIRVWLRISEVIGLVWWTLTDGATWWFCEGGVVTTGRFWVICRFG